ncbi:MAG: hypothetical protein HHAS10_01330 [Candidatus Altimarinota bacterium]
MNHPKPIPGTESLDYKCATCEYVARGANGRAFCILNQSVPGGNIPNDIGVQRLEAGIESRPIIIRRILEGMTHPGQENACNYHSEKVRDEEMQGVELTLLDWKQKPVDEWGLSVRVTNALKVEQVTLEDLIQMGASGFRTRLRRMGKKSEVEVKFFLKRIGVTWKE